MLGQEGLSGWVLVGTPEPVQTHRCLKMKGIPSNGTRITQGVWAVGPQGWREQGATLSPGLLRGRVSLPLHSGSFSWASDELSLAHEIPKHLHHPKVLLSQPQQQGEPLLSGERIRGFLCGLREHLAQGSLPWLCSSSLWIVKKFSCQSHT